MTTLTRQARIDALKRACDRFDVEYTSPRLSSTEDLAPYFYGAETIGEWAAVTECGEWRYIYPDFSHPLDAQNKAVENIGDDIHAESPVAVINLETGETLRPDWNTVEWRKT